MNKGQKREKKILIAAGMTPLSLIVLLVLVIAIAALRHNEISSLASIKMLVDANTGLPV